MYLFGILMVVVVVIFAAILCGGSGTMWLSPAYFLDIPSLLLLLLIVIPILLAAGVIKDVNLAFRMIITRKWDVTLLELKKAEYGVHVLMNTITLAGVFVSGCSCLMVLATVNRLGGMDMEQLCANLAVSMISLIYALMLRLILVPIKAMIGKHIIDFME